MRALDAPMLFLPPLAPVWVPNTRELTLGRSSDCDIVVPSPNASRRHAAVGLREGVVEIRDLGSTNGTYVNGERVRSSTALRPADQIDIGGKIITFCRVEARSAAAPADSEATVTFKREELDSPQRDLLRGDLREIPMAAVLQVLGETKKTGLLATTTDNMVSRLWLLEGRIVHAETGRFRGLEAAHRVVVLRRGDFVFERGETVDVTTVGISVTELLLEASRRLDESRTQSAPSA
jgi:pSer/pThr/pTyr-binding forkhead associated (FHA) protein